MFFNLSLLLSNIVDAYWEYQIHMQDIWNYVAIDDINYVYFKNLK